MIGELGISLKASTASAGEDNYKGNKYNEEVDVDDLSSKLNAVSTDNNDDSTPQLFDAEGYEVVPNPGADAVDLSGIRRDREALAKADHQQEDTEAKNSDDELDALEELVPDVKQRRRSNEKDSAEEEVANSHQQSQKQKTTTVSGGEGDAVEVEVEMEDHNNEDEDDHAKKEAYVKGMSMQSNSSTMNRNITPHYTPAAAAAPEISRVDSMRVQRSKDFDDSTKPSATTPKAIREEGDNNENGSLDEYNAEDEASSSRDDPDPDDNDELANCDMYDGLDGNDSDNAIGVTSAEAADPKTPALEGEKIPKEFLNMSSAQSLSTATQTHEVRMPMYLPTFKPATGCTNASDFIVRCFVARLRSGITVVKHGRSRWCKSRLRILHIHPDGCSLSWKPAEGEPTSNRRPPKLDLTECLEVRHAWSPDPQNPMYTGTPILRQKCEAANAHKSFALIFPKRTVDITAVTADQCKVLMEGFSALCFRLQVADLAGKGANANNGNGNKRTKIPEEDGVSTTASVTLTNSSTPRAR